MKVAVSSAEMLSMRSRTLRLGNGLQFHNIGGRAGKLERGKLSDIESPGLLQIAEPDQCNAVANFRKHRSKYRKSPSSLHFKGRAGILRQDFMARTVLRPDGRGGDEDIGQVRMRNTAFIKI